jgi:hypothetical protein
MEWLGLLRIGKTSLRKTTLFKTRKRLMLNVKSFPRI